MFWFMPPLKHFMDTNGVNDYFEYLDFISGFWSLYDILAPSSENKASYCQILVRKRFFSSGSVNTFSFGFFFFFFVISNIYHHFCSLFLSPLLVQFSLCEGQKTDELYVQMVPLIRVDLQYVSSESLARVVVFLTEIFKNPAWCMQNCVHLLTEMLPESPSAF